MRSIGDPFGIHSAHLICNTHVHCAKHIPSYSFPKRCSRTLSNRVYSRIFHPFPLYLQATVVVATFLVQFSRTITTFEFGRERAKLLLPIKRIRLDSFRFACRSFGFFWIRLAFTKRHSQYGIYIIILVSFQTMYSAPSSSQQLRVTSAHLALYRRDANRVL